VTASKPEPADAPLPAVRQAAVPQPDASPHPDALESGVPVPAAGLPPRSRGVIGLLEENCTVCMLCARECPDWCIFIESHKEEVPAPGSGRPRVRNALDRFAIDFSLCMYCGICIEVCPYDALFWSTEYAYPETGFAALTHEKERLREWMWTVPPPPAHDPGAPLPREAETAGPGTSVVQ
jgi:NADH-quinone oxidoreductase subunit I